MVSRVSNSEKFFFVVCLCGVRVVCVCVCCEGEEGDVLYVWGVLCAGLFMEMRRRGVSGLGCAAGGILLMVSLSMVLSGWAFGLGYLSVVLEGFLSI